jgi:peptide/nickel transport system permease protein
VSIGIASLVATRLLALLPMAVGVTAVMFLLTVVIPGDPALLRLGDFATAEQLAAMRQELGLDQPVWLRYVRYVEGMLAGDLGRSLRTGNLVADDLAARLPATLELALLSLAGSVVIGIAVGVGTAAARGRLVAAIGWLFGIVGVGMPLFWLGLGLIYVFYFLLGVAPAPTGRLPIGHLPPPALTGFYTVDAVLAGQWQTFVVAASHLVLPVITLTLVVGASISRMTYSAMRQVLGTRYIAVAHALGFSTLRITCKYALRNALVPVITFVGIQFGFLVGGVVLVETVFGIPGIGRYAVESLVQHDFAPVQGFVLLATLMYLGINFLVDVGHGLVDPRVRG